MGSGNKFEHRGQRDNRRTNRFRPEHEQMDSRVLLSTFGGSDRWSRREPSASSIARRWPVKLQAPMRNSSTPSLAGTTTTNYGHANATVESNGLPLAPSFTATARFTDADRPGVELGC